MKTYTLVSKQATCALKYAPSGAVQECSGEPCNARFSGISDDNRAEGRESGRGSRTREGMSERQRPSRRPVRSREEISDRRRDDDGIGTSVES